VTTAATVKILVIKFRNIGDVLLLGPLLSSLARADSGSRVSVLVKAGREAMLEGHPDVEQVWVYPPRKPGESRWQYLRRELAWLRRLRAQRFDWVINSTEGDRGALVGFLSGAPRRRGLIRAEGEKRWRRLLYTEPVTSRTGLRHTVVRNLDLLPPGGLTQSRDVRLRYSEADLATVRSLLDQAGCRADLPLVQVHPTSRWFFKCWNDTDVARVIEHLILVRGLQVVVTSGPDTRERDRVARILAACDATPMDLSGRLSLKETAALASLCCLFFGVDTAPMHMAAALNVPVVAIFGPSGAFDWGPWPNGWEGETTPYPRRSGVQTCGPHTVVQMDWPCVPCGQDGCAGTKRSACLEQLSADQVIPLVDQALQRAGTR